MAEFLQPWFGVVPALLVDIPKIALLMRDCGGSVLGALERSGCGLSVDGWMDEL